MAEKKKITPVPYTEAERRAIKTLSGLRGQSVAEWSSDALREKWLESFPGMDYPDENGEIKPLKAKRGISA